MKTELHRSAETLLHELFQAHPASVWLGFEYNRVVEKLIDIGFVRRTRQGVVITAAGISYYLLSRKIEAVLLQGTSKDTVNTVQTQLSLFGLDQNEESFRC